METLLYLLARAVVAVVGTLPLTLVARIGRACGALAYWIDARHRRVAVKNLTLCFAEKTPAEIRALARENFRRLGENYISAVKSASMSFEELGSHLSLIGAEKITSPPPGQKPRSLVLAVGHFGNFELYAHLVEFLPAYRVATTYRGLRQPSLNRLMQSLRERSGCIYFERRWDGEALKSFMNQPGTLLGLLADQRAAQGGVPVPFFGRDCSTNAAPAVFARRYHGVLHTAICYRIGLARWRLEVGPEIPTRENGASRSTEAIMLDVNRALEAAVRRDPANWFWVHDRWKQPKTAKNKTQ